MAITTSTRPQWTAPTSYTAPAQGQSLSGGELGHLKWSFGPEFEKYQQGLQGRAQEAAGVQAQNVSRIGGSGGLARAQLAIARGATEGERLASQAMTDAQARDLTAQGIRLQDLAAGESARQFGADLGEKQRAFDAQFALNQELGRGDLNLRRSAQELERMLGLGSLDLQRMLGLGNLDLQRELGRGRLDLDRDLGERELDLAAQRLGLTREELAERIRQFDVTTEEDRRQFELELGLERERMSQQDRQFLASLDNATLQSYISAFVSLGINPADWANVLSQIAQGDFSFLERNSPIGVPNPQPTDPTDNFDLDAMKDFIRELIDDLYGGTGGGDTRPPDSDTRPPGGRPPYLGGPHPLPR